MPNKRKPLALKVLHGTARKDRDGDQPEYEVTSEAQPTDPLFTPGAVSAWNQIVPLLESQRVLTQADRQALTDYCNHRGDIYAAWAEGKTPTAAQFTQLRMQQTEFGMTPASRAKVAKGEPDKSANPFAEFG